MKKEDQENMILAMENAQRAQRKNYYIDRSPAIPSRSESLAAAVATYSRGKMPIVFDFSWWQMKRLPDGSIGTGVDWKALSKFPEIAGGYCKMGQPYGVERPMQSKNCDNWFDRTWEANFQGMHDNGMLRMGYIYHDTAWPENRGMTESGFNKIWDGTITEVANKLITNDGNIYVAARKMTGLGRVFTAEMMRDNRKDWVADELIIDFEMGHRQNGSLIGPIWAQKATDMTMRGLTFLMDNGFLKPHKLVAYSSPWYFKNFMFFEMLEVLQHYDSIVAGYYWNENKGYRDVTIPELVKDLSSIPDSWQAEYFGACDPGDVVLMEQISAAHTLAEVLNDQGKRSAVDVNVVRIGWDALFARYPEFAKRYKARFGTPTNPPPVEPPIVIPPGKTKKMAKVVSTSNVRMRKTPSMDGNADVNTVGFTAQGNDHEVLETKVVKGQTWHRTQVKVDVWIAETTLDRKTKLLEVREVPV